MRLCESGGGKEALNGQVDPGRPLPCEISLWLRLSSYTPDAEIDFFFSFLGRIIEAMNCREGKQEKLAM